MPGEKEECYTTPKPAKVAKLSSEGGCLTPCALTPRSSFEVPPTPSLKRLGFGTGVNVMLYERSPRGGVPRSPWAIKKLRRKGEQACIAKRLEEEASILKRMSHPNIIGYRGFRREKDGTLILAVENGQKALYDIIEETRDSCDAEGIDLEPLDPKDILKVVKAVASALDYLHNQHSLLHGDLKSGNVLIIGDFEEIKLCDFGVTVPLGPDGKAKISSGVQYVGTEPWCAIEVIEGSDITAKTDIFALGCTIFEMLTLESPHFNKYGDTTGLDVSLDKTDEKDDDEEYNEALGKRPELPENLWQTYVNVKDFEKVFALFYACTAEDPEQRPTANQILEILDREEEDEENGTIDLTGESDEEASGDQSSENKEKQDKPDDKDAKETSE